MQTTLTHEHNKVHAIRENGTITMPEVGHVVAAGRTAAELERELEEQYMDKGMTVDVRVNPSSRYYYVIGRVKHPGRYRYMRGMGLKKAIEAAGGIQPIEGAVRISVKRGKENVYTVMRNEASYSGRIQAGDEIVVEKVE